MSPKANPPSGGPATSHGADKARFTDQLRAASEPDWTAAVSHRFTRELADGTLDDDVMRRYLIQDYSFLDSFVRLVGSAIAKAPSYADRLPFCRFLAVVTSDENTFFQRAFDALGVSGEDRMRPRLHPVTEGFHQVMAEAVASADYAETLAPLVVFEWLYLSWADPFRERRPRKFYHHEWIGLHASAEFASFVTWLRDQLDREAMALAPDVRQRVTEMFRRTVALERAFFEAAYELPGNGG